MFPRIASLVAVLIAVAAGDRAIGQQTGQETPLATRDGVQLKATFFPAMRSRDPAAAKQVTPVVLVHDFKGSRSAFQSLASRLQSQKAGDKYLFAVMTVDLRGHGGSLNQQAGDQAVALNPAEFRQGDFAAMAGYDMEAVRNFLVTKNDEGQLNLNKLCIVGSGMGACVAVNWAMHDWNQPPLAIGKQGQDVKALVLISPPWTYEGLSFQVPMKSRPLKENVAWLLMCGAEDRKVRANMQRIEKQLERFHPEQKDGARQSGSLVVVDWPSKLQGDLLVKQVGAPVEEQIVKFLTNQVAMKQQPWTARRTRLPGP